MKATLLVLATVALSSCSLLDRAGLEAELGYYERSDRTNPNAEYGGFIKQAPPDPRPSAKEIVRGAQN